MPPAKSINWLSWTKKEALTHLVLQKLGEFICIIAAVDDILHKKLLLHRAQLLLCVLMLVERVPLHLDPFIVCVKCVLVIGAVLNHFDLFL